MTAAAGKSTASNARMMTVMPRYGSVISRTSETKIPMIPRLFAILPDLPEVRSGWS